MEEMEFNYISVYALSPGKKTNIEANYISGGQLSINDEVRSIFSTSFNGILPKSLKVQPFHFYFEGNEKKNDTRDGLINVGMPLTPVTTIYCVEAYIPVHV